MPSDQVIPFTASPVSRVKLDPQGRLDEDIPCRKCGYNLRTLLPEGRCPECNTAVGRSLQGDYLRFADPNWVESLASGMNWIVASIVINFVVGGATGGTAMCLRWVPIRMGWFMLPGLILGLVAVIGYWKVTVPDPSGLGETGGLNSRKVLRFFQIGSYAVNPLYQGLAQLAPIAMWPASALGGVLGIIGVFAGFAYARRLALRIPNEKLARSCRIVMWGIGATMLLGVAMTTAGVFLMAGGAPATMIPATGATLTTSGPGYSYTEVQWPAPKLAGPARRRPAPGAIVTSMPAAALPSAANLAFAGLGCVMGPLGLVLGIWSIVIVMRLRKALNEASRQALSSWASIPHLAG